jgi:nucleoside-diphosphate-sugar epimerase
MMSDFWKSRKVVLLGGANIIGTHIAKAFVKEGAKSIRIVDDLSAGKLSNIHDLIVKDGVEFSQLELRTYGNAVASVRGHDVVFDLAAAHGGRGYVSSHALDLWNNLELDTTIFRACANEGVEKVIFSSSACAYPVWLQTNVNADIRLAEYDIDYDYVEPPDGPYGMEKLVAEMMLYDYIKAEVFKGCATRSYTVYGPLMGESHAIAAWIAKTMIKQEPFEVWGGLDAVVRNWTFVDDNAAGALLAAEHLDRGAINIGIEDRLTPRDALEIIWSYIGWKPNEISELGDKPTGPVNRVADATKLTSLGWKPSVTFKEGLERTIDWYYDTHKVEDVRENFKRKLTER